MKSKKRAWTFVLLLFIGVSVAFAKDYRTVVFKVAQMECENCERKVKNNMKFEKGMKEFSTDLKTKTVTIVYDADKTTVEKLQQAFGKFNYVAEVVGEAGTPEKRSLTNHPQPLSKGR